MTREFRRRWQHVRGLTREFVEEMPDDCLDNRPARHFASIREQAVHLVECQGVYQLAFRGEKVDFGRKPEFAPSTDDADGLLGAFAKQDAELDTLLSELSVRSFKIDWFGNRIGFWEYASVLLQHEALHHGQWAVHARLGGWQPPDGWIVNWGL